MTKTESQLGGVITALVTPFNKGELDLASLRRLVRHQLEQGVQGFVINGTTGESPTLKWSEVETLFETVRTEVAGQVPLILGTGSNCTATSVEKTRRAAELKADAALVVVPYYNKPPQRGLEQHFTAVAHAASIPVVLYNVPGRTIANLEPATAGRLSRVDGIVGIKDATGDMGVLESLRSAARPGFVLLSGDDGSCVDFCARGGQGVIAVASHVIGREMVEAVTQARSGKAGVAEAYQAEFASLMRWLYCEANPIPVKMALHWMGLLTSAELRLPMIALDEKFHKDLKACLKDLAKI